MWIAAAALVFLILEGIALFFIGKRYGQNKEKQKNAETQAADMAHDAEIAARPPVDAPFSGMRPKD